MYLGSYTCLTKHILILQIFYLSYRAYTYLTGLILVLRSLYLYKSTRRYYWTYTDFTELIPLLPIWKYP